ncbi:MAG: hypothetical protein ABIK09_15325 [Pseudomonadota bacterium]
MRMPRQWGRRIRWIAVAAGAFVLLLVTFFLVFNIGHWGDDPVLKAIRPPDQAFLRTLCPVLVWPDDGSYRWRVMVQEREGPVVFDQVTSLSELRIPDGNLRPGQSYRWEVYPLDRLGRQRVKPAVVRDFRLAPMTRAGPLRVFPGAIVLYKEDWHEAHDLVVECPGAGWVELGNALVLPDGAKGAAFEGQVRLEVLFDWRLAPMDPEEWGEVEVACSDRRIDVPVRFGPVLSTTLDSWSDSRMDLVLDTPSFANFESGVISSLTRGTCLGIALVVKFFYDQGRFGEDAEGVSIQGLSPLTAISLLLDKRTIAVPHAFNFRHWSRIRPKELQELMSLVHTDNINPLRLPKLLTSLLSLESNEDVAGDIAQELEQGHAALLARYHIQKRHARLFGETAAWLGFDRGHMVMALRIWRFRDLAVVLFYDPNRTYESGIRSSTILHLPYGGEPRIYEEGKLERGRFRYLVVSGGRATVLLSTALQGLQGQWRDLLETGKDLDVVPR